MDHQLPLLRSMRDLLKRQARDGLWTYGDAPKALGILRAAGFSDRDVQSLGEDAALLAKADSLSARVCDACGFLGLMVAAYIGWMVTPW